MSFSPRRRKFKVSQGALPALIMLATATPAVLIARPVLAQVGGPREAIITSSRGNELTLSSGSVDGPPPGGIYVARAGGRDVARLPIISTLLTLSPARCRC